MMMRAGNTGTGSRISWVRTTPPSQQQVCCTSVGGAWDFGVELVTGTSGSYGPEECRPHPNAIGGDGITDISLEEVVLAALETGADPVSDVVHTTTSTSST